MLSASKNQVKSGSLVSKAETLPDLKMTRLIIRRQKQQAQYYTEDLENGIGLDMVLIPGGSFLMGTEDREIDRLCEEYETDYFKQESPQHQVTVPTFFLGKYPVTQAQWRVVAAWEKVEKEIDPDPSFFKEPYENQDRWTQPVERVSWYDAIEFCARLSKKRQRQYRLPSEAEWEYACRAGTTTTFHFGETISTDIANYDGNHTYGKGIKGEYREQTTPVGYFGVTNAFGLYDMHGNVWEWCEDDWHGNYNGAPTDGNAWLANNDNATKVLRGGSWGNFPTYCRCASRNDDYPDGRYYVIGLRVARAAPRTQ